MTLDSVENASNSPETVQPWAALGLKEDEYAEIREILGRRPTNAELAMYSVMWSEHCSYKSSKVHLKKFGELSQDTPRGKTLAGIGENAGVIDIGEGWAVTFKVESHNSPSFVDPHAGAATGVGGIVRDVLAMGARPVAVMDPLRFGPLEEPDTKRVMTGAVAGVRDYGNTLGLPNIGGEVVFDKSYLGNPLINAMCVGVLRHEDLHLAHATGVGNKVVIYGARTGHDGIGGVSILASESFADGGPEAKTKVPKGDPEIKKRIIECTLELFAAGLVTGIQDLGGAGISCATTELASAGDGGMHVELSLVPVREDLSPEEILMSESQERMMAVVEPEKLDAFMEICDKWNVEAVAIGEVTDGDRLVIDWHGTPVVDVPPRSVAHDGPVYNRPIARPESQDSLQADRAEDLPRPTNGDELAAQVRQVVTSPNMADKSWVTGQFDDDPSGNLVLGAPENAGVFRVADDIDLGVAVATDCNGRFAQLDPYVGSQLALLEAYRNVAVTGAEPLAISDCLNFGSPEDPAVMWQFERSTSGLKDACAALGIPVTGGNVSFYNQTGDEAILPTPVVAVLGVIDDVSTAVKHGFVSEGAYVVLLGETAAELSGSTWAHVVHDHLGGLPPSVNIEAEKRLASLMQAAAAARLLESAHDLSDGGLAQAVAESAFANGVGVTLELEDPFIDLFSESTARAVVTVRPENHEALVELAQEHGVSLASVGLTGGSDIAVDGQFAIPVAELREDWRNTLPAILN